MKNVKVRNGRRFTVIPHSRRNPYEAPDAIKDLNELDSLVREARSLVEKGTGDKYRDRDFKLYLGDYQKDVEALKRSYDPYRASNIIPHYKRSKSDLEKLIEKVSMAQKSTKNPDPQFREEDIDDEVFGYEEDCPACGAVNLPEGMIGRQVHYRCEDCGGWYNVKAPKKNPYRRTRSNGFGPIGLFKAAKRMIKGDRRERRAAREMRRGPNGAFSSFAKTLASKAATGIATKYAEKKDRKKRISDALFERQLRRIEAHPLDQDVPRKLRRA